MDAMEDAAHSRISIGTFMGYRTEVLGTLDGMEDDRRVSHKSGGVTYYFTLEATSSFS